MNEKLSICILTYNRSDLLEQTIRSFIPQVKSYNIPIYISDNNSSDNTKEIVFKCSLDYNNIIYSRNSENLGFDGNLLKVVSLSSTKYCWLFGDDDILEDNAVEIIMDKIEGNHDLLVINASIYDRNMERQINKSHCRVTCDRLYDPSESESAFIDLAIFSSFVGCLVIKRELWNNVDPTKYLKTGFVHVGIIFEYLVGKYAYYISTPLIKIRLGNSGWSKDSFRIWYILWVKAISEIPYYNRLTKKKIAKPIEDISFKLMIIERAKGTYNMTVFKDILLKNELVSLFKKCIFFLIALIPIFIPKKLFSIYLRAKKPAFFEYQLFELNANAKSTNYV